jgi:CheY-like chemotaxis protein
MAAPLAVLLVEDEPYTLDIMATLMRAQGHQVATATSGPDAVAVASAHPGLAVALVDVSLPGYDGHEVVRRLRGLPATADAAIVAISARAGQGQPAREAGCDAFLAKPLDAERIFAAIAAALRSRGRLGEDEAF